jgi:hypothetical protein
MLLDSFKRSAFSDLVRPAGLEPAAFFSGSNWLEDKRALFSTRDFRL